MVLGVKPPELKKRGETTRGEMTGGTSWGGGGGGGGGGKRLVSVPQGLIRNTVFSATNRGVMKGA